MATEVAVPNQAVETLIARLRGPAVLEKLARDWGFVPRSPQEARQFLELADEMNAAKHSGAVKAASAGENPFLARAITGVRLATGKPATPEQLYKEAAVNALSNDQEVLNAALAYAGYLGDVQKQAAGAV